MEVLSDDGERDLGSFRLPRWGRVVAVAGVVPWQVIDPDGRPVKPIQRFLRDFVARGNRPGSVRSYAYSLLRWWRWLVAVGVEWDRATSTEVKDLVLWLGQATKPRNSPRTTSIVTAGTVNSTTRKRYLGDQYEPRTVRHGNAVLRSFYEFWIELGDGPLVNPVALDRKGWRPNARHNPLAPFRPEGRIRYNPKVPKRKPREMPDERWNELFAGLTTSTIVSPETHGIKRHLVAHEHLLERRFVGPVDLRVPTNRPCRYNLDHRSWNVPAAWPRPPPRQHRRHHDLSCCCV